MHLQIRIYLQRRRQFIQVVALCILLIVHQHHAGQVHFRSHAGVLCRLRDTGGVQRALHFLVEPLLQLRVIGVAGDFGVDQLLFRVVDTAIGLGSGNQSPQDRMAVVLSFRARQLVNRTHGLRRGRGLRALPGLIGLERHHPQRGQGRVVGTARPALAAGAAHAARTAAPTTQQTAEQPTQAGTTAACATSQQTTEQAAKVAAHATALWRRGCAALLTHRTL
ncbi:hypothetical protein D3C76_999730 [compost metagenome]